MTTCSSALDCGNPCCVHVGRCFKAVESENAELRKGHERYETARRMSPQAWKDAWDLNIKTDKPFDEIIDELRAFVRPK